ncbi:MAG: hypothetical protein ACLPY3_04710 [Solirubrobacteraceae bacterium]
MKPAWTAGVTRARLLLGRAIGPGLASTVAASPSLTDGLAALTGSAYGERVRAGQDLATAQRAVAETLIWHLRILAGWLPAAGGALVRALAGWFELANVDARLAALCGDGREPEPFALGTLATAWGAAGQAHTIEQLADALAGSTWSLPRTHSPAELAIGLRVAWARRVQESAPEASAWVAGAGSLLVARELLVAQSSTHAELLRRYPGIDDRALSARTLAELRGALDARAGWALGTLSEPSELWRAELAWWERVEDDSRLLLRRADDEAVVLAAVALLAVDAQRAVRALQSAAHGADPAVSGAAR